MGENAFSKNNSKWNYIPSVCDFNSLHNLKSIEMNLTKALIFIATLDASPIDLVITSHTFIEDQTI